MIWLLTVLGNLYIADGGYYYSTHIRKVDTSGIITTVAGHGNGYAGDGGPAIVAEIFPPKGIAINALGIPHIATDVDWGAATIRKIGTPAAFTRTTTEGDITFVEENDLGYVLSESGQHKTTIDLATGETLQEFGYNQDNNLISIADQFNNQVTIQRDANGNPTSINISWTVFTTTLTIDSNNHLTRITYPDGSLYRFEYASNGLMTAKARTGRKPI